MAELENCGAGCVGAVGGHEVAVVRGAAERRPRPAWGGESEKSSAAQSCWNWKALDQMPEPSSDVISARPGPRQDVIPSTLEPNWGVIQLSPGSNQDATSSDLVLDWSVIPFQSYPVPLHLLFQSRQEQFLYIG